jgi:hypothetical protein
MRLLVSARPTAVPPRAWLVALVILLAAALASPAAAGPVDDAYAAGYATAILDRLLALPGAKVTVKDGVLTLDAPQMPSGERASVLATLSAIPGVLRVEVTSGPGPAPGAEVPRTAPPSSPPRQAGAAIQADVPARGFRLLPEGPLFEPLIADPRWPHFSLAYQRYLGDSSLRNVGAISLGETVPLVRYDDVPRGQWELGLQAGIFAIFDLDGESTDLVNADYMVGLPLTYRRGDLTVQARVYHQSSHLGDEFLLGTKVDRVNLNYEAVSLLTSYDVGKAVRVYGGFGYLFRRDPPDLEPWSTQLGLELRSPWTFLGGTLRPIAGIDVKNWEHNDWDTDLSVRAGLQLENPLFGRKLQLLLEYFRGHSPDGQFYTDEIEYIALGLHFYLF